MKISAVFSGGYGNFLEVENSNASGGGLLNFGFCLTKNPVSLELSQPKNIIRLYILGSLFINISYLCGK